MAYVGCLWSFDGIGKGVTFLGKRGRTFLIVRVCASFQGVIVVLRGRKLRRVGKLLMHYLGGLDQTGMEEPFSWSRKGSEGSLGDMGEWPPFGKS